MSFGQVVKCWNWRQNFIVYLLLCFLPCQKNQKRCGILVLKSCNLFYNSWRCKWIHRNSLKPNNQNIANSTQISTFNNVSKWHDSHISRYHSTFWISGCASLSKTFSPDQKCNDPQVFFTSLIIANKKTLSHQKSYF